MTYPSNKIFFQADASSLTDYDKEWTLTYLRMEGVEDDVSKHLTPQPNTVAPK